jgi:IclR family KDG regulon transcriptional repressor
MKLEMKKNLKKHSILQDLTDKETSVQSVRRAADILKCVSDGVNSVTEIAAKCNLHKSTVHRLLKALGESDLVIQNPVTHQYYPGYQFVKISLTPATTHEFLVDCAIEEMQRLSEITGETIDLRIKLGLKNIGLDLVQSKNDLIVVGDSLRNRPVNIGVDGRVLLSQLSDEELSLVLGYMQLEPVTKRESIDIDDLMAEINLIRQQGYATSSNELIMGVTCICAPIKNYILPAVLIIVGPEIRMKPKIKDLTKDLLVSSARISKSISVYQNKILGLDNRSII